MQCCFPLVLHPAVEPYSSHVRFFVLLTLPRLIVQAPVVHTMDSAIHRFNHYPMDNSIAFDCVYPMDSDLSSG